MQIPCLIIIGVVSVVSKGWDKHCPRWSRVSGSGSDRTIKAVTVKPQEDGVRFYWISQEAVSRVLVIGSLPPKPPPNAYIF